MEMLGLDPKWARPEWLMVSVLPVPPPHVRPSVEAGGAAQSEDDLTHVLTTIVKNNLMLENCVQKGQCCEKGLKRLASPHLSCTLCAALYWIMLVY